MDHRRRGNENIFIVNFWKKYDRVKEIAIVGLHTKLIFRNSYKPMGLNSRLCGNLRTCNLAYKPDSQIRTLDQRRNKNSMTKKPLNTHNSLCKKRATQPRTNSGSSHQISSSAAFYSNPPLKFGQLHGPQGVVSANSPLFSYIPVYITELFQKQQCLRLLLAINEVLCNCKMFCSPQRQNIQLRKMCATPRITFMLEIV